MSAKSSSTELTPMARSMCAFCSSVVGMKSNEESRLSNVGLVFGGRQQPVRLAGIVHLDDGDPASPVGIFVDQLRLVFQGAVHFDDPAADRRVDVRHRLDRL